MDATFGQKLGRSRRKVEFSTRVEKAEQSDATARKWRSDFSLVVRSLAPFPPADRQRSRCQPQYFTRKVIVFSNVGCYLPDDQG